MTKDQFEIRVEISYGGRAVILEEATAATVFGIAAELEDDALVVGRAKERLNEIFIEGVRSTIVDMRQPV